MSIILAFILSSLLLLHIFYVDYIKSAYFIFVYLIYPDLNSNHFEFEKKKIYKENSLEDQISLCLDFLLLKINYDIINLSKENYNIISSEKKLAINQLWIQENVLHLIFSESPYSINGMPFNRVQKILNGVNLSLLLSFHPIKYIMLYTLDKNDNIVPLDYNVVSMNSMKSDKEIDNFLSYYIGKMLF